MLPPRCGDEFLVQRGDKTRKDAHAMDFGGGSLWGIEEEENLDEEQLPPELTQFENEAFAMHFKIPVC